VHLTNELWPAGSGSPILLNVDASRSGVAVVNE